ncbi:MAG TPA: ABC transporter substrate-binding protein [Chitinispirillaceae bacterium]|nr:ABC transporter substrate-binding protein [Chitinispirillaceae bacterium]
MKNSIPGSQICIAFLLLAISVWGGTSSKPLLKNVHFLPIWVPQPQFAGYYMAKEKGIYEKFGLDVNIINGDHTKDTKEMLVQDKADFTILYLSSAIKYRAQGVNLVNVAQIFQKSAIQFVSMKSSGIDSLNKFQGKKIAIWRTVFQETTEGFLKEYGIDNEIYRINGGINLFLKGAIDVCAIMKYNEINTLYNQGIDYNELNIFDLNSYRPELLEDGIYMMNERYKADSELASAFVHASIEGWEYALKNFDETIIVMLRLQAKANVISNRVHTEWMLKSMRDMIYPEGKKTQIGHLEEDDFNAVVEFLAQHSNVKNKVDYHDFYKGVR